MQYFHIGVRDSELVSDVYGGVIPDSSLERVCFFFRLLFF
jgi:hypothetical protein